MLKNIRVKKYKNHITNEKITLSHYENSVFNIYLKINIKKQLVKKIKLKKTSFSHYETTSHCGRRIKFIR